MMRRHFSSFSTAQYSLAASSCSSHSLVQLHITTLFTSSRRHAAQYQQQQKQISLRAALNQFKRAGAHPDLVSSIDPELASENGRNLIELERLLSERQTETSRAMMKARGETPESVKLRFWMRSDASSDGAADKNNAAASSKMSRPLDAPASVTADPLHVGKQLRLIECTISPFASDSTVYAELKRLFQLGGLPPDISFTLPVAGISDEEAQQEQKLGVSLAKALKRMTDKMTVPTSSSSSSMAELMARCDVAADVLRGRGVVVALRDASRRSSWLLTMPEAPRSGNLSSPSGLQATNTGGGVQGSILSRNPLDLDPEQRRFMAQRSFEPFDLRMINSDTIAEAIVDRAEQLASMYLRNQGTMLRPGVCYLFEVNADQRFPKVTGDGCIALPLLTPHLWPDFLCSLSQPQWTAIMQAQDGWRSAHAPLLRQRQSQLARVSDMLHYNTMELYCGPGSMNDQWVNKFLLPFLKEEVAVRKTVEKYGVQLRNNVLKRKGVIECLPPPPPVAAKSNDKNKQQAEGKSTPNSQQQQQPLFRLCADGTVQIMNTETATSIGLLKFLRDNNSKAEAALTKYSTLTSHLEHISHAAGVRIAISQEWRHSDDSDMGRKLQECIESLRESRESLAAFARGGGKAIVLVIVNDRTPETGPGILPIHWSFKPADLKNTLRLQQS